MTGERLSSCSVTSTTWSHTRHAPRTVSALASLWQIRDAAELDLHVTGRVTLPVGFCIASPQAESRRATCTSA
jgi:hypothetical protein